MRALIVLVVAALLEVALAWGFHAPVADPSGAAAPARHAAPATAPGPAAAPWTDEAWLAAPGPAGSAPAQDARYQ